MRNDYTPEQRDLYTKGYEAGYKARTRTENVQNVQTLSSKSGLDEEAPARDKNHYHNEIDSILKQLTRIADVLEAFARHYHI